MSALKRMQIPKSTCFIFFFSLITTMATMLYRKKVKSLKKTEIGTADEWNNVEGSVDVEIAHRKREDQEGNQVVESLMFMADGSVVHYSDSEQQWVSETKYSQVRKLRLEDSGYGTLGLYTALDYLRFTIGTEDTAASGFYITYDTSCGCFVIKSATGETINKLNKHCFVDEF